MVLTPGPGEPQDVLGSLLLVLESRRVCWGPHSWSWRAAGCAGVLSPGPEEPQGVLRSSHLILGSHRVCWGPHSWSWRATGCAGVLTPGPGEPHTLRLSEVGASLEGSASFVRLATERRTIKLQMSTKLFLAPTSPIG